MILSILFVRTWITIGMLDLHNTSLMEPIAETVHPSIVFIFVLLLNKPYIDQHRKVVYAHFLSLNKYT